MQVEFRFTVNQKVETPFGDVGIVSMVALDAGGKQVFVNRNQNSNWFPEDQIIPAE